MITGDFVACSELDCNMIAEVTDAYYSDSVTGPVWVIKTRCLYGHTRVQSVGVQEENDV